MSDSKAIAIRHPQQRDAVAMWQMVSETDVLDTNSSYAYLLLCTDFASTCLVAEQDGQLVGFVTGYRPPPREDALFVWQIAVHPRMRGQGLAKQLLRQLIARSVSDDAPLYLEATVSPSNRPSRRLFESLAEELQVPIKFVPHFRSSDFPDSQHEEEPLLRIGPIRSNHARI